MTLHKLSAGSGYEYLTRQVAALDSTEKGHVPLADYYSAKGESPGVWLGSGLSGIDQEEGSIVTAEQMLNLFGHGLDPTTGDRLGRPYRLYESQAADDFRDAVARRVETIRVEGGGGDPASIRSRARSDVARAFFVRDQGREPVGARELDSAVKRYSRPTRVAVAGFDLTFSPVKSVSTLWAIAPREVAAVIEQAHQSAVSDALRYLEREALFTREGLDGARQVDTRGLIAAQFTHRDSRAGDPDLHTHVAVANKVQTAEGKWLAIYGRVLYESAVAASETYNTALEAHLSGRLGVRFAERSSAGIGTRSVREIVGIEPALNQHWSKRRQDIDVRRGELAREFQQEHGRPPTPGEAIALAQQANLDTRQAKHDPRSSAEQRDTWRRDAVGILGTESATDEMVRTALASPVGGFTSLPTGWIETAGKRVVDELEQRRATWRQAHVRAEALRQVRTSQLPADEVNGTVEAVVSHVLERLSINLTPDPDPIVDPESLRREDGTSVYRHGGRDRFTSQRILSAEEVITTVAELREGRTVPDDDVDVALVESAANGMALNEGQAALVRTMATSGARVQVAIAPAGAGKTTAMQVLARAWTDSGGHVVGLAPSAAAASALQTEAGIRSDTLAKFVHKLDTVPSKPVVGPATLLIVDEAGMADTLTLARVIQEAVDRGASVRLIGDDAQLSAVGAGGVLRDIARAHDAVRLEELMRFDDPAEAAASFGLRGGDVAALGFYLDRDRIHIGDTTGCVDDVFASWSSDTATGLDSLMLAPTRDLVLELNQRARVARTDGTSVNGEVALRDGSQASVGDTILTRRNDRRISISDSDWVKNGDRWTVTGIRNGALDVRHRTSGLRAILPSEYVAEHVQLGYASTVHTAQGVTADTMHGIAVGSETRQMLYTMMTRGRHANHVHLAIARDGDLHQMLTPEGRQPASAAEVVEAILARDGSAISATTEALKVLEPPAQLRDAVIRYSDGVVAAAEDVVGASRVDQIAQRAEELLPGLTSADGWPSLAIHLLLAEASGTDAAELLDMAITYRSLDDSDDPAAVIGWRLDTLAPQKSGPLPWLSEVPDQLAGHPTWGPYLTGRASRVDDLEAQVREEPHRNAPGWEPGEVTLSPGLIADVQVWRAAFGVPDSDRRPTGSPRPEIVARDYQRTLDRRIEDQLSRHGETWIQPIVAAVGRRDSHTPVLAERLARLAQDGHDAGQLLASATRDGQLPDDHATAALDSRITRLVDLEKRRSRSRGPERSDPAGGLEPPRRGSSPER
ncbi:MobF family relaxase [Aeromicrobium stalagmiti]|uniref:MobF family relaxase n=1 Tax=Aeromicrobium stalagmiti TaxID=2738988 RepID=UPI00156830A4|nr:MobF family relaxase [Aeromicrobium stalagmiti]NRQ51074.1 relaxase domain-containing protein [Aeromicrobium stalagmiti]